MGAFCRRFWQRWDLSIRKDESGGMRLIRLGSKLAEIKDSPGIDILVFESARGGMPGRLGALVVQAEIQGAIKLFCENQSIEYRGYSPSEIKKHATGKGNSNKKLMMAAALEKFGKDVGDNEADALWLLDLAKKELRA